jgi:hypothetical protein
VSISYPIYPPQLPGDAVIEPVMNTAVAIARSPYTSQAQTQEFPGESLGLKVRMPKMTEADARAWVGFLASLWGPAGSCYFGEWLTREPLGAVRLATNLLNYPQQFNNAAWILNAGGGAANPTVTANAVNDPLGALTADQIDLPITSGSQFSQIQQLTPFSYRTAESDSCSQFICVRPESQR